MPHHKEKTRGGMAVGGGQLDYPAAAREDPIQHYQAVMENYDPDVTYCCKPGGCHFADDTLNTNNLSECVKVICNNEHCREGKYMHAFCFEEFEKSVLNYLKTSGRARSWSEKQRLQNLWNKKGYDLAYRACTCKCGKGHLRKDQDWEPGVKGAVCREEVKKRRNRRRKNDKPSLTLTGSGGAPKTPATTNGHFIPVTRLRSSSMSSNGSGSGSPASSGECSSPTNHQVVALPLNSLVNVPASGVGSGQCKSKHPFFSDRRERHNSGSIFSRRQDYSSFNTLPRHKINSYHIKMEDEGSHGNDDTRCFLLSTLSTNKVNRIPCILCHNNMIVFDRYPLIDGTFFLSPRQHSKGSVPIVMDGAVQYLNAVCMGCLEGWSTAFKCRYCQSRWNGSHLILGSMYSYDIFAATPCCPERLRCNNCHKMVIPPEHRLNYFSDYSHSVACPHCRAIDFHFVKSLSTYHRRELGE